MRIETIGLSVRCEGMAERLSGARVSVGCVLVRARSGNRGLVYVGDASVTRNDPGLSPGRTLGLRGDPRVDLFEVFVAADWGGDGVDAYFSVPGGGGSSVVARYAGTDHEAVLQGGSRSAPTADVFPARGGGGSDVVVRYAGADGDPPLRGRVLV